MIRTTLFACALVASVPALAQTKPPAAGAVESISRAKVIANAEAEFARVDTNKDGQMSRAEIETFQRAAAARMIAARNKAAFAVLDTNKNGQISAAEFAKLNDTPIKVDPSSVLSIDTNKDGQISLAEHRSATLDTFTQFDANKDGTLTAAEAKAAAAAAAK
ncbi:MAG TPA: EF-hand domain-containing protein [Sphingomicrobium sp.]|nr:EF-hand domain-containing protein [Sphingomicrobium sp.]